MPLPNSHPWKLYVRGTELGQWGLDEQVPGRISSRIHVEHAEDWRDQEPTERYKRTVMRFGFYASRFTS